MSSNNLRTRKSAAVIALPVADNTAHVVPSSAAQTAVKPVIKVDDSHDTRHQPFNAWSKHACAVGLVIFAFALLTRFYKLDSPAEVVFDEVHFGKFAAYYLRREYYFDVHPPLAKMLFALAGYLSGFKGDFDFENIGDSYIKFAVPYLGMRAMPALFGSLTVLTVFAIMRESGYPIAIAAFSASLILFDNAHVAQTRLILLDAALILFMALSLLSYIKFYKLRHTPFTTAWWTWCSLTGISLACTLGCKMVGLFTFITVGCAVCWDLWKMADYKKGLTSEQLTKHFIARILCLILLPAIVYLSFFYVHFKILRYSGTGDTFMSPKFQETLLGNPLLTEAKDIFYGDVITMKNKDLKVYLHSHAENYPLRYDDGRVSSQGQQVTGYPFNDTNNEWVMESHPFQEKSGSVQDKDVIRLRHLGTNTHLLSHDVASPLTPTNQEFTTLLETAENAADKYNDTLFTLTLVDGKAWKSKASYFKLMHVPTKVGLYANPSPLPDWGFKQQEINGHKNAAERGLIWFVDEIVKSVREANDSMEEDQPVEKKAKSLNFFSKFFELQMAMLSHNAGLTASHPYASQPIEWPFLITGISFWTKTEGQQQIYMIGNLISWWLGAASVSIFIGIWCAEQMAIRRGSPTMEEGVSNRLTNNAGFFLIAWASHYFPFYLMSRQLFVHHYLPAHLASTLVVGAITHFVISETINFPLQVASPETRRRFRPSFTETGQTGIITLSIMVLAIVILFVFVSPLTYGTPGLLGNSVNHRKLLSSWTLHFMAKEPLATLDV